MHEALFDADSRWTIPRTIAHRRHTDPEVQALVSNERAITWAELDDASRALARRLARAGLSKGDRVGVLMPNGIEWATVAFAVTRIGGVLVPLSTLPCARRSCWRSSASRASTT